MDPPGIPSLPDFEDVAAESEVPEVRGLRVLVDGRAVALFRAAHGIIAMEDVCPHAGAPLSEGVIRDGHVTCAWHGFRFDATTGECPLYPGAPRARLRAVRIESGRVLVSRQRIASDPGAFKP
jgi:nitrite reductase/ring-hydroxylating ferredoxin subunit